ncbi:hypothetical protein ALC57_01425 [Trachymyrmex cornetzi]|uniref:RNA-directed DNA polymerase from mobile element jockey n=1 Tax=Trachymyrmex cornetzi TaxID=471704 RepID=A0A151JQC7_9HYME|nr:hypothetical protein ALC57_01425 [Trachymyrmex cornetzi]
MLLLCLPQCLDPLLFILNFALSHSTFPSFWKHSIVLPIPKTNNPSSPFRLISLPPFLSKVLECICFSQLNAFISEFNVLPSCQSGFRQSHSTTTELLMKKLSARWVPRLLTVDNKRLSISKQCLKLFKHNPNEFLRRVVTVDETWIHYYTPETKQQSNEEVIAETEAYFVEFDKSYFSERLKKWQKHWEKCILLKGDYVKK